MLRRRPALRFALLLSGGILLAQVLSLPLLFLIAVPTAALLTGLMFRSGGTGDLFLQAGILALGLLLATHERGVFNSRRLSVEWEGDTVKVIGILEEDPSVQGKTVRLTLAVDSIAVRRHWLHGDRRVMVYASARKFGFLNDLWRAGTPVAVAVTVEPFPQARNPGEFDYGRYLTLNEIDGFVWLTDTLSSVQGEKSFRPAIWFSRLRADFGRTLREFHGPLQASFLLGVILGERRDIPADVKQSFVNTGTVHILAVSGSNTAVIAAALYVFLGLLRLPKRPVILCSIAVLIFYMMLVGTSASIVRATIMAVVMLAGRLLERRTDIHNSIATSALIILLWSPSQLFDVGFQLSFAAVLSIVLIYPTLERIIRMIPARFEEIKAIDAVLKLFAVSLAAQLGTLPFTAYYFEKFSIVSLAANMLVVPMVGVNLLLGCVTLIASAFSGWIAASYAALNEVLMTFLLGFVKASASVPFAYVQTAGFSFNAAVLYYLILLGVLNIRNARTLRWTIAALFIFLNLNLYLQLFSPVRTSLVITALDVGQGDALVVQFPNGRLMLVDAGPITPGYDAGERVVVPFLERHGLTHIDILLASHPHSDHIGGMPFLVTHLPVDSVFEADTLTASRLHENLRTELRKRAIGWRQVRYGAQISPDNSVRVYCLAPIARRSNPNLNNNSIVLRIVYGKTSAMLLGDAETEEEQDVVSRYGPFLQADLMKAGHHGSSTSSSPEFLHGMNPNFAILSVGVRNKFRHPSPAVIKRMAGMGIEVDRTDREGAIIFQSDGAAWTRIRWRTERP